MPVQCEIRIKSILSDLKNNFHSYIHRHQHFIRLILKNTTLFSIFQEENRHHLPVAHFQQRDNRTKTSAEPKSSCSRECCIIYKAARTRTGGTPVTPASLCFAFVINHSLLWWGTRFIFAQLRRNGHNGRLGPRRSCFVKEMGSLSRGGNGFLCCA